MKLFICMLWRDILIIANDVETRCFYNFLRQIQRSFDLATATPPSISQYVNVSRHTRGRYNGFQSKLVAIAIIARYLTLITTRESIKSCQWRGLEICWRDIMFWNRSKEYLFLEVILCTTKTSQTHVNNFINIRNVSWIHQYKVQWKRHRIYKINFGWYIYLLYFSSLNFEKLIYWFAIKNFL